MKVPNNKGIDMYYSLPKKTLYLYWATDLLPHEINQNIKHVKNNFKKQRNSAIFVGSIWIDPQKKFGNRKQIVKYINECHKNDIKFERYEHIPIDEHRKRIKESLYTFTIVGKWQKEKEYIPCRIFKNISYGGFGITNSQKVYNLFDKKICYNDNESQLFYDSQKYIKNITLNEQIKLMEYVRDNHTYINRINTILWFIKKINK